MKSFKEYIQEELFLEQVSQEVDAALNELNLAKLVNRTFRTTVKSPLFKKAVALFKKRVDSGEFPKESPQQAASAIALQTDDLDPREFVEFLTKLKLLK